MGRTDLSLPTTDTIEDKVNFNFKTFRADVDMTTPIFKLGMVFANVEELRKAIDAYSIRERRQLWKKRNEKDRLEVYCKGDCQWRLKAAFDSRSKSMLIKEYVDGHTCNKIWKIKALTAPFLSRKYIEMFRDDEKMSLKAFAATVQREYNMIPSRHKLGRARKEALRIIHGDEEKQYNQLWDYGQEIRKTNPGSTFFLTLKALQHPNTGMVMEHFSTLYYSLDACKRGFLQGCRPIICIDGCHIKTKHGGQLLAAVGIDPNECIYPIAMGVVEVESTNTWKWFLATLKNDLNIINTGPYTIMSDKQKVVHEKTFS